MSNWSKLIFEDKRSAWFWLIVRVYVGWEWFVAGWEKIGEPAWTGNAAGAAVKGFLNGALAKTAGAHPDVSTWYAYFIQHFALPNAAILSYLVAYGEAAVGIGLILGAFTALAAFFGVVMNFSYLFAGTVSVNPQLALLGIFLILARRVAGSWGLDRWIMPKLMRR